MEVTIINLGGSIQIVDNRDETETSTINVLKDGLRLQKFGDICRILFKSGNWFESLASESEVVGFGGSVIPADGDAFYSALWDLLADYGGATELNDLTDVLISAPSNAEVLTYDSASSKWINSPSTGSGGGDMTKAVYDTDNDGVVDKSETVQIIVRNSTGATLTKGQIVYLSGATGNRPNAILAKADAEATSSKTIGWVTANIANNADGYVGVSGSQHDLDTSSLSAGDALWLSATVAGGLTATMPTQPNHAVFIGYCARSHPTQGRIVFKIQNGYELQELHNVLISSVADNDGLFYESSTQLWKNKTIPAALGFTPVTNARTVNGANSISGGGDLTANRTFELVNDETAPLARKFYSTSGAAARGWRYIEALDLPVAVQNASYPYVAQEYISGNLGAAIIKIPGSNVIFSAYTTGNQVIATDTSTGAILSTTSVTGAIGLVYVAATGQVWAFGSAAATIYRFTAATGAYIGSTAVTSLTASCKGIYDDSTGTGNVYAYNGVTMNIINASTYARTGVTLAGSGSGSYELTHVSGGAQSGLLVGCLTTGIFGFNISTNTVAYFLSALTFNTYIKYVPSLDVLITSSNATNSIKYYTPTTSTTLTLANTIGGVLTPYQFEIDETEDRIYAFSAAPALSPMRLYVFALSTVAWVKSMILPTLTSSSGTFSCQDISNKTIYAVGTSNGGSIAKIVYG